ncbi:MAG TPA: hypothetical protein VGS99_09025, partial [Gammaproteobacteria bacterium]|nr:hypothetical protein [Gammaproteobacteria bacterium]
IDATAEWYTKPAPLSAARGMHRFVWDLHLAAPAALGSGGVWALPGEYRVKLTVDGESYSQPLTVVNDPRVKVSEKDLVKQQALALQIQAQRAALAAASDDVSGTLKQLAAAEAKAPVELAARLQAFEQQLSAHTEMHAVPPGYGQPGGKPERVGSLAYVSQAFDALQSAVEDADGAPTPDALKGYAEQKAKADAALAQWQHDQESIPPLNVELKQAGLPALDPKQ